MKHAAKKQWLVAAVFTILAGTVGGVNAGAVSLAKDHLFVRGNSDNVEQLVKNGGYIYGITPSGDKSSVYLDEQTLKSLKTIGLVLGSSSNTIKEVITGIQNNTTSLAGNIEIPGDSTLTLEDYGKDYVRYYGVLGGDTVVNANLHMGTQSSSDISVTRTGNNNIQINGGSVIGGAAGGTAAGIGNVDIKYGLTLRTGGNASNTLDGSVTTNAAPNANLLGYVNGGLAAGIGGTANSTVTGNTELTITGKDRVYKTDRFDPPGDDIVPQLTTALNVMKGSGINAIGVTGGGAAVTTIGGTAKSEVKGDTTINVTDGTVIAAFGGGAAASVDATGVAEALLFPKLQLGNDDGTSDITGAQIEGLLGMDNGIPDSLKITVSDVNQGGTATSTTGKTNINLTGKSSALGVFGGGAAAATHTYTWKADGKNPEQKGYNVNDEYGTSNADATTGRAHISVNLRTPEDGGLTDTEKGNLVGAFTGFASGLAHNSTQANALEGFSGKGAVVGVFGGGLAAAQSGNRQLLGSDQELSSKDGAFATASTEGADIDLASGYAVGVFGGGLAGTINNATATASMTDSVNINIGKDMETVGVFGNGLAYFTGSSNGGQNHLKGQASVTAENTSITVEGKADGVFGGGLVIDDSQSDTTNATSALSGKATITVSGTVAAVNFGAAVSTEKPGTGAPGFSDYANGANAAVGLTGGNVAIAGGGVALGGGAASSVGEVEINVQNGSDITGNVIAGGAAAYGAQKDGNDVGGSTVGTATINLEGGKVTGDVYAGGAVATVGNDTYNHAKATVGEATINLRGTEVTGILSGGGLKDGTVSFEDSVKAGSSTLNLIDENTLTAIKDKSKISGFTDVNAKAGSVTKLEGLTAGDTTPLIDGKEGGTVTVDTGAKLDVSALDGTAGNTYLVANSYATGSTFWTDSNLAYDFLKYTAKGVEDGEGWKVKFGEFDADQAADRLGSHWTAPLIAYGQSVDWADDQVNPGANRFFNDWRDAVNAGTSTDSFNRAGLVGEDTAVTGNTVSIASDMADHVVQRLSFTEEYIAAPGWVNEDGGIWAKYVHKKYEAKGLGSTVGGVHASSDYDGAIVGMDFAKKGKLQYGAAFHYGTGEGNGVISSNDYDAWGLALYGSLKDEAAHTNLMADIGYTKTSNDITGHVNGKSLTADRDVDVWTLGVRGEKEYISGRNQIVPYAGLRYIHTAPSRYTSYYDGQKAFDYDAENQDIWLLPVGVSLRNETVTASGWKVTPKVDLSYIWAFGDTDGTTDVWMNGGVSSLAYTVMDDSWLAAVGVEATKDVWSYGLGYSYQKGDDTKSTKWYVSASYAF